MPVLGLIKEEFEKTKPLKGVNVIACLHVTVETANLIDTMLAGGANIALTASNPLSTQDDVAAALAKKGVKVYAIRGEDPKMYYENIEKALKIKPNVTLDDGADVIATVHSKHKEYLKGIYGGCEETTTGVIRLRAMAKDKALKYPVVAVNDAETKMMFDNRYGTGQSTLHGIMNATNVLLAGKNLVVVGYGWCGRGVASRAMGMGSNVIVVEVNPRKALEAAMDGYWVMNMSEAAKVGDIFVTVTGDTSVIRKEHFAKMKDQAIVCNSGHFNVELDLDDLKKMAKSVTTIKNDVEEYVLKNGNRIYVLGRGPVSEPRLRLRPPARGHGHELRQPGAVCEAHRRESQEDQERGLQGARGDRQPRREHEAQGHGHQPGEADKGAGEVPQLLEQGT